MLRAPGVPEISVNATGLPESNRAHRATPSTTDPNRTSQSVPVCHGLPRTIANHAEHSRVPQSTTECNRKRQDNAERIRIEQDAKEHNIAPQNGKVLLSIRERRGVPQTLAEHR
eukprot:gene9921-biopygen697